MESTKGLFFGQFGSYDMGSDSIVGRYFRLIEISISFLIALVVILPL